MLEASVVTSKESVKSGSVRVTSEAMASLSLWNEIVAPAVQENVGLRRRSVMPAAIVA